MVQHVVDEGMGDHAVLDRDGQMRVMPAERGPAVHDERAHGRAIPDGWELDRGQKGRIFDVGDTAKGVV